MICTTSNNMYYVEWFALRGVICTTVRWMIWTTLNDLCSVELFVQQWIICSTALNCLHYVKWFVKVEWFAERWMIFYFVSRFVWPQMICTALNNLYYAELFGVRWIICATLNHLDYDELLIIGLLVSVRCAYSRKYCKIFYSKLWVDFSWFGNIKKKFIRPSPRNWS